VQVVDTSPLAYGVGARVGLSGVVGDLRILAASYFNMFEDGASLYYYGYDWLTSTSSTTSAGNGSGGISSKMTNALWPGTARWSTSTSRLPVSTCQSGSA